MAARDTAVVILAAGKGTRLKSECAKVLHSVGGRKMIEHVVRACLPLKPTEIVLVLGHQAEEVEATISPFGLKTVLQQPQRGTGHAVQVARRAIPRSARFVMVVPGDAPLLRAETLAALVEAHRRDEAAATILAAELDDPTDYGRIVRNEEGGVAAIAEENTATAEQRAIREVNSSTYCFTQEKLWPALAGLRPENVHHELYLTETIAALAAKSEKVRVQLASDPREILGCNTRVQLAEVDRIFRQRKAAALMDAGVTIFLPETVVIDPDVEAGPDTVIEPCVQLLGKTRLGERCVVRTGSVVFDSRIGDDVKIEPHSMIFSSHIEKEAAIGPFARLRPGAEVKRGGRVGNFVEMKNAVLQEGAKALHLTYLGDASIGRATNIGAGTITCNYDGAKKHRTTIGDRVFIGSDTALVAPVSVGNGAYVAAGSTITEDVPSNALGIARGRQVNKPGWAVRRRTELAGELASKRASHKRPRAKSRRAVRRPARRGAKRASRRR